MQSEQDLLRRVSRDNKQEQLCNESHTTSS
jgi:hypothetical protein